MKKQAFNPFLPSFEYVPDGEPHVFGDRLYLYGSHDRFDGAHFCLNDYVCWSAPVDDLSDWRYEGIIYRKEQDPRNQNIPKDAPAPAPWQNAPVHEDSCLNPPGVHAMWAPDVVRGPDGRYYLYYCLDYLPEIAVAVCKTPAGAYEFLGFVHDASGASLGTREGDVVSFDPGVFVDDDGLIYLYSGNSPRAFIPNDKKRHSKVMTLEMDMITLKTEPRDLIPDIFESKGTGFEGHEFFEASSIRKIDSKYYFVYSSVQSHELCYAISDRPDGNFVYGGTLVDIGDIFLQGRRAEEALNSLGNTHGSLECVHGQWYVFYHRQTNQTNLSRQACAEKIYIQSDGTIQQVAVTSCGLNDGPLIGSITYPARIACEMTRHGKNVMSMPKIMQHEYPYFTQDIRDFDPTPENIQLDQEIPFQYVANIKDGAQIGFKYFRITDVHFLSLRVRGKAKGTIEVLDGEKTVGKVMIELQNQGWQDISIPVYFQPGIFPLFLQFHGSGSFDFIQFSFMS